jgi:hypothetical protein
MPGDSSVAKDLPHLTRTGSFKCQFPAVDDDPSGVLETLDESKFSIARTAQGA